MDEHHRFDRLLRSYTAEEQVGRGEGTNRHLVRHRRTHWRVAGVLLLLVIGAWVFFLATDDGCDHTWTETCEEYPWDVYER